MTHARTIRLALTAVLGAVLAAGCSAGTPTESLAPDRPLYDGGVGMIGGGRSSGIGMIGGGRSGESDADSTSTTSTNTTGTPGK